MNYNASWWKRKRGCLFSISSITLITYFKNTTYTIWYFESRWNCTDFIFLSFPAPYFISSIYITLSTILLNINMLLFDKMYLFLFLFILIINVSDVYLLVKLEDQNRKKMLMKKHQYCLMDCSILAWVSLLLILSHQ